MTVRRLGGSLLLLAAVLAAAATGCSGPVSCSGAAAQPPYVALNTKAWMASHPTAELRACFDQRCAALNDSEVQVSDGMTPDDSVAHTVTITATEPGSTAN